jgi:Zn-dependent membrane protease YugP
MYFNSYYLLLVVLPLILGIWAQARVSSAYSNMSRVLCRKGLSGAETARMILDKNGLDSVRVERVSGRLTDHFDPRANVVRLSEGVYESRSVAAVGIAAHECGHAVQYGMGYAPIVVRGAIAPIAGFGSKLAVPLVMIGLLLSFYELAYIGLIGFALIALFQLVTLPVEFNASRRALDTLEGMDFHAEDLAGVKTVLSAAAMTYVAALVATLSQLLHMLLIVGGGRRRD